MVDNQSDTNAEDATDAQHQLLNELSEHSPSVREGPPSIWAKFTADHLMRDCPYTVGLNVINTSLWDVPALEDADETHATTWVAKIVHDYYVTMTCDNELFDDFKIDFED
jgi:hypothetical protein